MSDYQLDGSIQRKEIPTSRGRKKKDYDKLIRAANKLDSNEALKVKVSKPHIVQGIRDALDKAFNYKDFHVVQRRDPETKELYCYITPKQED